MALESQAQSVVLKGKEDRIPHTEVCRRISMMRRDLESGLGRQVVAKENVSYQQAVGTIGKPTLYAPSKIVSQRV